MSRIAPLAPPYSEEVQASFDKLMPEGMPPLGLFRVLAHNPRVLRRIQRGGLLDPGSISLRIRELVILRTCVLCGADYEWGVHAALFSGAAGFDELERLAQPSTPSWTDEERAVLEMCDALHSAASVPDALFARLSGFFTEGQLIELVALAGLYHAVSFLVNVSRVGAEPWAPARPGASTKAPLV